MSKVATSNVDDDTADMLLAYLRGRDAECPACQYNLRDLREPRCPECGEALALRVQLTEPKVGWLIAGVAGLSAGAGFSLLMMIYFLITFSFFRRSAPPQLWHTFWLYVVIPLVIQSFLLWLWLKLWRRVRQLDTGKRILVLLAWTMPAINILLFTLNIR